MTIVNKNKCIGCGTCTILCPKSFKFGDDGLADFIGKNPDEDINTAIDSCPVNAIEQ